MSAASSRARRRLRASRALGSPRDVGSSTLAAGDVDADFPAPVRGLPRPRARLHGRSTPRAVEEAWGSTSCTARHEVLLAPVRGARRRRRASRPSAQRDGGVDRAVTRRDSAARRRRAPSFLSSGDAQRGGAWGRRRDRWRDRRRRTSWSRTRRSRASRANAHAYRDTDLRQRLARYHDDPDSAFWAGTTSGCIRRFASGRSRTRSPPSRARCSPCRAGRRVRHAGPDRDHRGACRGPNCWCSATAGIRAPRPARAADRGSRGVHRATASAARTG